MSLRFIPIALLTSTIIFSCRNQRLSASIKRVNAYTNLAYDDSILSQTAAPFLMPFNRIIEAAGTTITYGDVDFENHTLDAVFCPDKKTIVVEDRYGIAFIDVAAQKVISRWSYGETKDYKKAMGVYSGVKALLIDNFINIFWTAADPSSKKSVLFQATWDGKQAVVKNTFSFEPFKPSPLALPNDIALQKEGNETFIYVVLNGNSQLVKIRLNDKR